MKKAIIIMMAAAVVTSCTPKRPVATTTAVATQPIITTTAGTKPQLKLNSSNSSQADSNKTVTKASEEGHKTTAAKDTSAGTETETPQEKPAVENNGNEEAKDNADTAMPSDTNEGGTETTADITDVKDIDLGSSVVQAGETVISLPSSVETFESSGFIVDYDSAKYSDEDAKTYADAHYNGERVVLGYNADTNEVSEVIITQPGLRIPGGFTVGDTLQSFRDHFGYWGGDIYQVGNSEYTVYGTDTITKIEIKHK